MIGGELQVPEEDAGREVTQLTLRLRGLLSIYAVIPLCLLAYAIDRGLLDGALHDALPRNPEHLFVYGLLFGWPHIVASNLILISNAEYRRAFRRRVLIASLVIVAFFGIGGVALPSVVLSVVVATATVIHVFKQQIGIGTTHLRGWLYPAWGWTGIATGILLYNALYLEEDLARYQAVLGTASLALAAVVLVLAAVCHRRITTALGRAFLWGNTAMVLATVAFHHAGYDFFALAIPRIIHDVTAFTFYVVHDHNKHRAAPSNALYRAAARLPGGVYWLSPALAVALTFALEHWGDRAFDIVTAHAFADSFPQVMSLGLLSYLGMLHYYTESFTWRKGSPYRRYVSLRST